MGAEILVATALLSTGATIASAQQTKSDAKKQASLQKEELRQQQKLEEARIRRATRIRQATLRASGAAQGAPSSALLGGLQSAESFARAQTEQLTEATALQSAQIDISRNMTINDANAQIGAAIGSFAKTTFSPDATELSPFEQLLET